MSRRHEQFKQRELNMKKFPFVASQSQKSREYREPLDKEKDDTNESAVDDGRIRNEYTSFGGKSKTRVIRY